MATAWIPENPAPLSPAVSQQRVRANPYDATFWLIYLANFLLVTANALSFRFADFVVHLGGSVGTAGLIVGWGTAGSLALRLFMGRSIDRYGPRPIWLVSAVLFVVASLGFVPLSSLGPVVYAARLLYTIGLAGMFTCAFVCVSIGVTPARRAEVIGILGTSGFLGMLLGPVIGDVLFNWLPVGHAQFAALFGIMAGLGLAHLGIVWSVVPTAEMSRMDSSPSSLGLFARYWPGSLVAVALVMGVVATVPSTFLTRFAAERNLSGIGFYFGAFAVSAALVRVLGRTFPERIGRPRALLLGLGGMQASMLCYLGVHGDWQLIVPGLLAGIGHGLLFPCTVSLGADAFPDEHRGTAMTLVMGFMDLGMLLGAPSLGVVIDHWGFAAMFLAAAATLCVAAVYYGASRLLRRRRLSQARREVSQPAFARSA